MSERIILSEKLEDNKNAVEWGIKQEDLIKKGEEITQRPVKNVHPGRFLHRGFQAALQGFEP